MGGGAENYLDTHRRDPHPIDNGLRRRLVELDPDGQSTIISRQADGSYIDLRTLRKAATWQEIVYPDE